MTDAAGNYSFINLAPGTHRIGEVVQQGYSQTSPAGGFYTVTVGSDQSVTGQDFGNTRSSTTISGTVFADGNGNGTLDAGESGLDGWTVFEDLNGNGVLDTGSGRVTSVSATDVPRAIPDSGFGNLSSTIAVSGLSGNISQVTVSLDITHPFDSDLVVVLVSPSGAQVHLVNNEGRSGRNFINTTFDDAASVSISAGAAPFTGSFQPETALSAINGTNPNGNWMLIVADTARA